MKKILCIVMLLSVLLAFAGCSSQSAAGTYELVSMKLEGMHVTMEQMESMGISPEKFGLTLHEDGTGTMKFFDQNVELTWDGENFYANESTLPYVLQEDTLTLEYQGDNMEFTRTGK